MGERVLWAFRHDLPGASDEQLTDRARHGDQSAFGELYRRHRKAAESTAWCLLRSKSDVDDVVSDAFAGVLSALRNGRGPRDNFRGYLLACVRNGCRSRRNPTVLVDEDQLDRWNPVVEDPERFVEADTVARAFSTLAPRWQHTLWMTEVEQLPPSEVSERLELTPNAAAALTHRARQAFAEAYLAEHLAAATGKECRKIAPLLPGYVRDQLRDLQQASVERHVVNCQVCARAVDDLRDVNASLRSLLPLGPAAVGSAAATQAVVAGTTATVGGGLSIGLPSTGVLLKGLLAVALVAPVLSTDSPFSGRGGDDQRALSVPEIDEPAPAAGNAAPQAGTRPSPTAPSPTTIAPETTRPTTSAPDDAGSGGGQRPTVTVTPTDPPAVTVPQTTPFTVPVTVPVTVPSGLLPIVPGGGGLVDDVLEDTVEPLVGNVSEPVVETLDEALAVMGLGSTGETITVLRSIVPLLDGPLLGSVVGELLDVTSIGGDSPTPSSDPATSDPATDGIPVDDSGDEPAPGDDPDGGSGVPGAPGIPTVPGVGPSLPGAPTAPPVAVPAVPVPTISLPSISVPPISIPPVSVPIIDLPPITVPVISLPVITVPAITLPALTIPDLLG